MYYFSGTSKKYIDAQQFCARVNAYLVEFYDLVQYTAVRMDGRAIIKGFAQMRFAVRWTSIELQILFRMRQKISA